MSHRGIVVYVVVAAVGWALLAAVVRWAILL